MRRCGRILLFMLVAALFILSLQPFWWFQARWTNRLTREREGLITHGKPDAKRSCVHNWTLPRTLRNLEHVFTPPRLTLPTPFREVGGSAARSLGAGWHCVVMEVASQLTCFEVIVQERQRKRAEFAAAPWSVEPPVFAPLDASTVEVCAPCVMPHGHVGVAFAVRSRVPDTKRFSRGGPFVFYGERATWWVRPPDVKVRAKDKRFAYFAKHRSVRLDGEIGDFGTHVLRRAKVEWSDRPTAVAHRAALLEATSDTTAAFRLLRVTTSIEVDTLHVPRCSTLLFEPDVVLFIRQQLFVGGTNDGVVAFSAWDENAEWGGIVLREGAVAELNYTLLSWFGSVVSTRMPGTGTHIRATPAITAAPRAALKFVSGAIVHGKGPGIGAAAGSLVTVRDAQMHDVAQGVECVGCILDVERCSFAEIPFVPPRRHAVFRDDDNDAIYVRGGHARIARSLIAQVYDDGIDSASARNDPRVSTLQIVQTTIEACLHEGIALSGSVNSTREVLIQDVSIRRCQQGIENGHTPSTHRTVLRRVLLEDNNVGIRYGDNYPLRVEGRVVGYDTVIRRHAIAVLNVLNRRPPDGLPRIALFDALFEHNDQEVNAAGEMCGRAHVQLHRSTHRAHG